MGSYGIGDLGSGGPKMELWGTGTDGFLWDLGFGVGWMTKYGDMGLRDEWGPMGCGIWGRVAPKWRYGAQGWMGIDGLLWDVGFGVEWTKGGVMGPG